MELKKAIVNKMLGERPSVPVHQKTARAYAPTNIALIKYWGKRDRDLNLPMTGSLSIALPTKGAWTSLSVLPEGGLDRITLNGERVASDAPFANRMRAFLDLFRPKASDGYAVDSVMNIPVAAGLASSACGFAALVLALNALYDWSLSPRSLSILARLGSGSACRSLWNGWVEWEPGELLDGSDSFAMPYSVAADWSDLRIGLLLCDTRPKSCSSREAMQRSVDTSPLYAAWPERVGSELAALKQALAHRDFRGLGQIAEANAEAMHACMHAAVPSVNFDNPETQKAKAQVKALRAAGVPVFYTQDAGPNLKLLFLSSEAETLQAAFPNLISEQPFVCMSK
jgi:diphosphomevalonate decarboxylase